MSAAPLNQDFIATPGWLVGLTVDQYHRMIEEGILEEGAPIELLDGFLVRKNRAKAGEDPTSVAHEHCWAVENLQRVLPAVESHGHIGMHQQPVVLMPDSEPEPDGAIIRGTLDDYRHRKPRAMDVSCVIEVADSSLDRDRGTKQRIYADAGIPQYVIVNLIERVVEVYERPRRGAGRYDDPQRRQGNEPVLFRVGDARLEVPAASLLP
jgi:Uma2 family endonuclease